MRSKASIGRGEKEEAKEAMGEAAVAEALVDPRGKGEGPAHDAIGLVHVGKYRAQGAEGKARGLWPDSGDEGGGEEEERGSEDVRA